MSEPRFPTRVSDPDETTRIPKDALNALRDADQDAPAGHPSGAQPAVDPGRPGSAPPPRTAPAGPNSGATPSVGSERPSMFRPANGTNGSGVPAAGPSSGS